MFRWLLFVCVLSAASLGSGARAEEHEIPEHPGISDDEVSQRLVWLEHSLERGAIGASLWWGGWMSYAVGEGAYGWARYAHAHGRLDRDIWFVTGLGSSLWVAQMAIFPMTGAYAPLSLRRMPRDTPEQRRRALAKAEALLERSALAERESLHWSEQVLDLAWAFGSAGYILGRGWKHVEHRKLWRETTLELAITILITEAAIFTTPRKAIRDLKRYQSYGPTWEMAFSGTSARWALRF